MAEHPRHHMRRNAFLQGQRRAGVPQVVEADEYLLSLGFARRGVDNRLPRLRVNDLLYLEDPGALQECRPT